MLASRPRNVRSCGISLLSFIVCPYCAVEVVCITGEEVRSPLPDGLFQPADRTNPGPGIGPLPAQRAGTPLEHLLLRHAMSPAPPPRALEFVAQSGLLVCTACGRWFPIERGIPELLPDHLRDPIREAALFQTFAAALPEEIRRALERFTPGGNTSTDAGAHHKAAEISIQSKVDDPAFFGPGFSSPFNPWNTEFTLSQIKRFGVIVSTLDLRRGESLIDSGCGYGWTTEWLFKSGINVIGVDICRTYLDIAVQRVGTLLPHLLVADVENLPIRPASVDAVLAFESFHHLPNRQAAMRGYDRALRPGGRAVLAEPGAAHEHAQGSLDAMSKYGILEKGMELDDVRGYAAGTAFGPPEQIYVTGARSGEPSRPCDASFAKTHSLVEGNLFRLSKGATVADYMRGRAGPAKRWLWPKIKRRLKAAALRIGLD